MNNFDLTYSIGSLYWLIGGGIVGFILRDLRDVLAWRTGGKQMASSTASPDGAPKAPGAPPQSFIHRRQTRILGALILLVVVVSVILDVVNSNRQLDQARELHRITACQARLDEQFLAAIKGRSIASNEAQDALNHLIGTIPTSVAAGKNFAIAFHAALIQYDDTIARINRDRPKLPPLPSKVCH